MTSDEPETAEPRRAALTLPEFTPVPRERMRRGGWSAERQRKFIELLAETGSVRAACRALGVGEHHIYKLRRHPEAESFRRAWEAALDCGIARIEDVAMDRALHGHEQPVYSYGRLVGTRRVYNDRLLMFLLSNRAPERFGAGGGRTANRAPDAIDRMERDRLRKRWRAEWEAERQEDEAREEAEVRASLDQFLEDMRSRRLAAMTPRTRALEEALAAARAEDLAEHEAREAHPMLPGVPWPRTSGPDDEAVEDGEWVEEG